MRTLEQFQNTCENLDAQNLSKIVGGDHDFVATVVVKPNGNTTDVWDKSTGDVESDYYYKTETEIEIG